MSRRTRSLATLLVLVVVIGAGAAWGWSALTSPLPDDVFAGTDTEDEAAVCTPREVSAGTRLRRGGVTVSVFNAGDQQGGAASVLGSLTEAGFAEGVAGDAPDDADVARAQIWTEDPSNPAVRLVATWLGDDIPVIEREVDTPGVYVVVGNAFDQLSDGRNRIPVREDTTVCGPASAG